MSWLRFILAGVLTVSVLACDRTSPPPSRQRVSVTTADGVGLSVQLCLPNTDHPPGIVLVHGVAQDARCWEPLLVRLVEGGYGCAVFDLRGHGESTVRQGEPVSHAEFESSDWAQATRDIAAARKALLEAGADPRNVCIVGAGMGANLALRFGAQDDSVEAVVLVSPGVNYEGVRTEQAAVAFGKRPMLLLAAEGDAYAAASCRRLKASARGFAEILEYSGGAHGTDLFTTRPLSVAQVVSWLDEVMTTGPSTESQHEDEP
ncbi:MAG: alpha/beta fold hydrolase [bacterium]|nr:alpha/beta fold hydrolase [bacterium]